MNTRIELHAGDITQLDVEAIVNAANSSLMGGGGVDGAIHKAGGPQILEECMAIRERQGTCPSGRAVITTGGQLKAKYVIHAVGPVWQGGVKNEDQLLAQVYHNSLQLAVENKVTSIAFPNISTGTYGFPKQRAAKLAIDAVTIFLKNSSHPEKVIFCCFDEWNFRIYDQLIRQLPAR